MSEEFMKEFGDRLQEHIEQLWSITQEVNPDGEIFTRAVMKGHPLEMIHIDSKIFTLNLN
jgi:hypothetical protein